MIFAQLTYRESLWNIEACLLPQAAKFYHTGFRELGERSTLVNRNESREWYIWENLKGLFVFFRDHSSII